MTEPKVYDFASQGEKLRQAAKDLVHNFMLQTPSCGPTSEGLRQAVTFRECGLDWGDYEKASSTNQQYWLVALLRALEAEGKVERVSLSGPWRIKEQTGG